MKKEPRLGALQEAIEAARGKETSNEPRWSEENKALGQCAVTAPAVRGSFGCRFQRVKVFGLNDFASTSHYYNELPDDTIVDLTIRQFPEKAGFSKPEYRERERLLSNPSTASRYKILRDAVSLKLSKRLA